MGKYKCCSYCVPIRSMYVCMYVCMCEQIDPCSGYPSVVVPYVLIVRAVKPCSSGARYFGLAVGLEPKWRPMQECAHAQHV